MAFIGNGLTIGSARRGVVLGNSHACGFVRPIVGGGVKCVRPHVGIMTPPKMTIENVANVCIAVYGAFMAAGGVAAFAKTNSKPSLVSGVISGILLGVAYSQKSVPSALAISILLVGVFAVRYVKTKKIMPAGLLGVISLVFAGIFAAAVLNV